MKILEVRDGFIKFEADKSIYLSSFIQVDGTEKSYIAQVNQIRNIGTAFLASARILFLYINGELFNYDKTLPPTDAEIKMFTKDIINNSINAKRPIIVGKTLDNTTNINIDASAFDKKMLVSADSPETHNMLIRNFSKQFGNLQQKTVVIDTLGIINAKKYTAGKDFKLPLNTTALNFMYESCLNDATAESKATIVDIFKELAEYSETVPFVPFETLKSIIDDMVDKQYIFKLLILKNKLAKFEKLGYFASKQTEAENLDKILQSDCAIIDLSKLDPLFQNNYLDYIYGKLTKCKNIQVFLETANTVSKKNLKKIITESDIPTTIVTHSKFKYLNDIKNLFDNFIIEPGITNNEVFSVYSTFLTSMQKNTYLTAGEAINYIPLVSEVQVIDDVSPYSEDENEDENSGFVSDTEMQDDSITDEETEIIEGTSAEAEEYQDTGDIITEEAAGLNEENSEPQDENENPIDETNLITNEEAIAVIEEKTDSAIASVSENLEEPGELDLFSEEENFEKSDEPEETIENNASYQEEITGPEDELTEESANTEDDNEILEEFEEIEDSEESENFDVIEDVDSSEIIEVSENDVYEIDDNTPTEEFDENSLTEEPVLELSEENNLSEFNEDSEMISNIDDELIQNDDEMLQNSDNDLSELSSVDNDNFDELAENSDDNPELSEEDLTDNNLQTDETDELSLNDEFEETSVELDNDADMILDEVHEEQDLTEELPETNIDVDLSEPQVIPVPGEDLNHDFDELVELDASESSDDDIIVDLSDNNDTNELDEEVEQQIMEDVDKVYTTMKNDDSVIEEISDSDLDLIDELNSDGDELEEYTGEELEEYSDSQDGIINEIHEETPEKTVENDSGEILEKRDSNTPIVPVYDADIPQEDMVMSDPIQQGDAVMHVKYGNGVVEKMIKYGNKTLFAINFENIGRRLLDPTLTEIKKV